MKTVEKELLKIIWQEKTVTARILSEKLNVSPRSIKNYVQNINRQFPGAVLSSGRGYAVDHEIVRRIMESQSVMIPQTSKERVVYIENRLINHDYSGTLNLYDLCDEIFVSLPTLKKDIQIVKREMKRYDLELISKGDEIEVSGAEKNRRKMLSAIIYKESGINFVNLQAMQVLFPDIDIGFIKSIIIEIFDQAKYFTNDYCLMNLILHIAIAIDRMQHGNTNHTGKPENLPAMSSREYELSKAIARRLETRFHIHYSEEEIRYMVFLILSRATAIDYTDINVSNLRSVIGSEYMDIVEHVTGEICDTYYIDLNSPDFVTRFALHIKNLAVRCRNHHYSKNPFTQEIQTTCPLIYDMALHASLLLENKMNITINDDETAYIALHLGSALEEQKSRQSKVTAVLYCPNYYDMSLKISDKINHAFSERLIITGVITDESEIPLIKEEDLIISTIPLSKVISVPSIHFPFFSSAKDDENLSALISELERNKRQKKFESYLRQLINPAFIEVNNTFVSSEDVIHYMVEKFVRFGYVTPDFEHEVLERENLSSTAFGNFAIPHTMKMNALKTGINILICDHPVDWSGHSVQLVLMMCFNKNERRIFNEIYDPLTMTLSEPENIRKIITCRTYEQFIARIVSMIL